MMAIAATWEMSQQWTITASVSSSLPVWSVFQINKRINLSRYPSIIPMYISSLISTVWLSVSVPLSHLFFFFLKARACTHKYWKGRKTCHFLVYFPNAIMAETGLELTARTYTQGSYTKVVGIQQCDSSLPPSWICINGEVESEALCWSCMRHRSLNGHPDHQAPCLLRTLLWTHSLPLSFELRKCGFSDV